MKSSARAEHPATEQFPTERASGSRLRALARSVVAPVVEAVAPVVDRAVEALARAASKGEKTEKGEPSPRVEDELEQDAEDAAVTTRFAGRAADHAHEASPDSSERVTERMPSVHTEVAAAAPRVAKKRPVRKGLKNAKKAHGRRKGRR